MKRIIGLLASLVAYAAVGTVLAQAIALGWMSSHGFFADERVNKALAVLQGVELTSAEERVELPPEQPSLEDLARAEAMKSRQLELREAALKQGLEKWKYELARITEERQELARLRDDFEQQLLALKAQAAENEGQALVRATLERSKPKDAKRQLQEMLERNELDTVVSLLADMPTAIRAKIAAEFKTPEETEQLADIYRRMRERNPELPLVERTATALGTPPPGEAAP